MSRNLDPMLNTDLIVVLPGIMGSTLRQDQRLVWAPSAGSVLRAVRTFGRSIKRLQLPDDIGDAHPDDGVEPVGLMPDLHVLPGIWTPAKGYDWLLHRLRRLGYRDAIHGTDAPPGNLLPLPYDWRLSNRYTGRWIGERIAPVLDRWRAQGGPYADAQVVFICHSMGGLVARWYIEECGGAEITRKLITLGTPYRGAVKALEQLVNGVPRGLGKLAIDLTDLACSLPSLYQLLPEYACIEQGNDLVKTTETTLPELARGKVADGMAFHTALQDAEARRTASLPMTHAILGTEQPTWTTARLTPGRVVPLPTYQNQQLLGDSTVPLVGAARADVTLDSNMLRRVPDKHGNLQHNQAAFDEIKAILTGPTDPFRGQPGGIALQVSAPELLTSPQPVRVQVTLPPGERYAVRIAVTDEAGRIIESRTPKLVRGTTATTIDNLPPGAYTIDVTGTHPGSQLAPVSTDLLIWDS